MGCGVSRMRASEPINDGLQAATGTECETNSKSEGVDGGSPDVAEQKPGDGAVVKHQQQTGSQERPADATRMTFCEDDILNLKKRVAELSSALQEAKQRLEIAEHPEQFAAESSESEKLPGNHPLKSSVLSASVGAVVDSGGTHSEPARLVACEIEPSPRGSGPVSFDELRASLGDSPGVSAEELKELFEELDQDRDGKITHEEFREALKAKPSVEVLKGTVNLLESAGVLAHVSERLVAAVKQKLELSFKQMLEMPQILQHADATDLRQSWKGAEDAAVDAFEKELQSLRSAPAATLQELNEKYMNDGSAHEAVYKDQEAFRHGVEGSLGLPGVDIFGGMKIEFCSSADSKDEFTTSNYGGTETTPEREYAFVVSPEEDTDYGGGRTAVPLEVFLYAVCARKAGSDGEAYDAALEELEEELREGVKTVLLRRVKEAGITRAFLSAAARQDARLHGVAEASDRRLARMREGIKAALQGRALETSKGLPRFTALQARLEEEGVMSATECDALVEGMRARLRCAGLWEEEVTALRLYTGPAFMKLNGTLRERADGRKGNTYASTIFAAISGMVKLAEISPVPPGRVVYRGQRGRRLPRRFWEENAEGVRGGTDPAFLSTTTNLQVAMHYAEGGRLPVVFAIQVGGVDSGAALGFLSQYPDEEEILMPPRSFLEVVGDPTVMAAAGGAVLQIPVKINCNASCPTLEKLRGGRKAMLVSTLQHMRKEIARDVDGARETEEFKERTKADIFWDFRMQKHGEAFLQSIKAEGVRELAIARERPPSWFNVDAQFRRAMVEALDVQRKAMGKLQLWMEEKSLYVWALLGQSAMDADRQAAARLRRLMGGAKELREREGGGGDEEYARLARRLCSHLEILHGDVDDGFEWSQGETALMIQAAAGNEDKVQLLLDAKANADMQRADGTTALMLAAEGGHTAVVVRLVKEGKANVNTQGGRQGERTALMYAADSGQTATLTALMRECGADARLVDEGGRNAAMIAAFAGQQPALQVLVCEGGLDVNAVDNEGTAALLLAAQNGQEEVVAWLLEQQADVNSRRETEKGTALILAAQNGHEGTIHHLLLAGCDVNAVRDDRMTALMLAALNGRVRVVSELVRHKADVEATMEGGFSSLMAACQAGHHSVVSWLVLEGGAKVDARSDAGGTALDAAVQSGHEQLATWLVREGGADVAVRRNDGVTPLMTAAGGGTEQMVAALVEFGGAALVNAADSDGNTALMAACAHGNVAVVKCLVLAGKADVDAAKPDGWTALMSAVVSGHADVAAWLVCEAHADANAARADGATALMYAAGVGMERVVRLLLSEGRAKVQAADKDGGQALMYAAQSGHVEMVAQLVQEGGADANARLHDGRTALMLALLRGHEHVVRWLATDGNADVEAATNTGVSALMLAAANGKISLVAVLVEHGRANTLVTDKHGATALMYAALGGHEDVVSWLLRHGRADAGVVNRLRWQASHCAEFAGFRSLASMLVEYASSDKAAGSSHSLESVRSDIAEYSALPLSVCAGNPWHTVISADADQTITFATPSMVRYNKRRCSIHRSVYFEVKILEPLVCPQFGFATARAEEDPGPGAGDIESTWVVDGQRSLKSHDGCTEAYLGQWRQGDVVGLGCDLQRQQIVVSVNGDSSAPHGVLFQLAAPTPMWAVVGAAKGVVQCNFGDSGFLYPPTEPFVALARAPEIVPDAPSA